MTPASRLYCDGLTQTVDAQRVLETFDPTPRRSFEFGFPRCPFLSRPGGHGEMGSTPARRAALRASASASPRCAFMVPPKINTTRFLAPPQKAALGLASRDPLAPGCPATSGAEKENNND